MPLVLIITERFLKNHMKKESIFHFAFESVFNLPPSILHLSDLEFIAVSFTIN